MTVPATFSAGTTLDWLFAPGNNPGTAGWAARLFLRGPAAITLDSTPDPEGHRFTVSASTTTEWTPGQYTYVVREIIDTNATQAFDLSTGMVRILPDLANQAAGVDVRSHAMIVLDNINAVIEKRATQDQQRYKIQDRELWRTPLPELLQLRTHYASLVRQEQARNRGLPLIRTHRVRFR